MGIFRKERQTPETLLFLADAEEQTARRIRRDGDPKQEQVAQAHDDRGATFRRRAAKARKAGQ